MVYDNNILKRHFTLIELLIVIGIIAILMTMLLPALRKAKEITMRATCANNERQLFLGWTNYCDNYNEYMPVVNNTFWGHAPTGSWNWQRIMKDELSPATKLDSVNAYFVVPGGYLDCPVSPDYTGVNRSFSITFCNYGMNYWGIGGSDLWAPKKYVKLSDIRSPSEQIGFGDSGDKETKGAASYHPHLGSVRFPHINMSNALFCDGHVAPINISWTQGEYWSNRFEKAPWGNP